MTCAVSVDTSRFYVLGSSSTFPAPGSNWQSGPMRTPRGLSWTLTTVPRTAAAAAAPRSSSCRRWHQSHPSCRIYPTPRRCSGQADVTGDSYDLCRTVINGQKNGIRPHDRRSSPSGHHELVAGQEVAGSSQAQVLGTSRRREPDPNPGDRDCVACQPIGCPKRTYTHQRLRGRASAAPDVANTPRPWRVASFRRVRRIVWTGGRAGPVRRGRAGRTATGSLPR